MIAGSSSQWVIPAGQEGPETDQRWADLVNARFEGGYPTAQAAALRDEIRFQRGVQLRRARVLGCPRLC